MKNKLANQNASARLTPDSAIPKMEDPGPLCAAHTPNFPRLLRQLGASLLVTTSPESESGDAASFPLAGIRSAEERRHGDENSRWLMLLFYPRDFSLV
jgi:hypothetical protein